MKRFLLVAGLFLLTVPSAEAATLFTKNLHYGLFHDDEVTLLQKFLTNEKLYSGPVTGNFFSLTFKGVKAFQVREHIFPQYGYFGIHSRTRANQILESTTATSLATSTSPYSPLPPPRFVPIALSCRALTLAWDPLPETYGAPLAQFKLERNGRALAKVSSATNQYADTTVSPRTSYVYKITSVSAFGNRSTSTVLTIQTPDCADTTSPTISLGFPASGTVYRTPQTVRLSVSAYDNVRVTNVEFYEDSTLKSSTTASPFYYNWIVTSTENGTHEWFVKIYDGSGNAATSDPVTLIVSLDVVPPTVSLSSSLFSTTQAQAALITATVSDDRGISKVEFYDGGILKYTDSSSPYVYTRSFGSADNGTHVITAKAYDTSGNTTVSDQISISVAISTSTSSGGSASASFPRVGISIKLGDHQYGEGTIAIDPTNPNHLVAVGIDSRDQQNPPASQGASYYSYDGGATWQAGTLNGNQGNSLVDPQADFDSSGNVYVVAWTRNLTKYPNAGGIFVYKSTDGGRTYPTLFPITLMGPSSTPLTTDNNGNLVTLNDGAHIVIDRNATPNKIYLYFAAHSASGCCAAIVRSTDGGVSFSPPHIAALGGIESIGPNGEFYLLHPPTLYTSTDDTGSFSQRTVFPVNQTNAFGYGNWERTTLRADNHPSSPYKGYLFTSYDDASLDGGDVFFRRSTDGGTTWSDPIKVNDDAPNIYCNGKTPQYLSSLNVAPNGRIDVVWFDRRNDPYRNDCNPNTSDPNHPHYADLYYAYSTDGGLTFSPNIRISQQSTFSAGDYIWVGSGDNAAYPLWTQYIPNVAPYSIGGRTLYTAKIDFSH